ncbi:helix-turn-helix domain-containing protein [Comamonas aquatica]|uniref:helix-turn-helix domain-containing protein n=1 Tax=Comamonas aquatica TaxID=225991 RepID=UPI0034D73E3A
MTEVVDVSNAEQEVGGGTGTLPSGSAGQMLRQAREQRQVSLQSLAGALKVPPHKLQALEEDRWDLLTDSVFTRSLALSVCRVLQIPSAPVMAGLPKHEAAKLASNPEGINTPFKEKTLRSLMSPTQDSGSGSAVKLGVAVLIAAIGGAGLYFLPQWQEAQDAAGSETHLSEAAPAEPLFMPAPEAAAPAAPEAAPAVEVAPAVAEKAAAPALAAPAAPAPSSAAEPAAAPVAIPPAAPAATAAGAAAPAANGTQLRFTANAETWVQVRDAQQRVVIEKILKSGDVFEDTAAGRPLHVVVGNAGATTLQIDGAAFDLAAAAKNNVARFEVK